MRICENCGARHWRAKLNKQTGLQVRHKNGQKVFICVKCGTAQEEETGVIPSSQRPLANILYLDIETSKSLYYNYGPKVPSKYLNTDDLVHEWYMISWAASLVGSETVWTQIVTPTQAREWDDSAILQRLHDLMDASEIIAGHNVDAFDFKKINTRFMLHGIPPITGKKTIDTLKIARSKLSLESNKLDWIEHRIGLLGKDKITNADWLAAMSGDAATLNRIKTYNIGDVTQGKAVLEWLLPIASKKELLGAVKGKPAPPPLKSGNA